MAFGTGLDSQLGLGTESAYGTFIAPSKFLEVEEFAIDPVVKAIDYFPLTRGPFLRSGYHREKVIGGTGTSRAALLDKGTLRLLKHMLGVAVDAQVGTTVEYTHTFTPDMTNGYRGLSATVQGGIPQTDGTVQPFTGLGGKVTRWEIAISRQDWLKITATWDFQSVVTSQALAVPSYASGAQPFSELDLTLTINGVAAATLESLRITGDIPLDTTRFAAGGVKREPLLNGQQKVTGTLAGSEFDSMTAFNNWLNGTEVANVVATLIGPTIPTLANPYKVTITIPVIRYTGDAPKLNGPAIVKQDRPFEALYNGSAAPITIVVNSDETAS